MALSYSCKLCYTARVPRFTAFLLVSAFACGAAGAQVPSFRRPPAAEYQDATFLGVTTCSPDPYHANCAHRGDRFYTILINGKPYLLHPVFTLPLLTMAHILLTPGDRASMALPGDNVLAHVIPGTGLQIHLGNNGVDVRVLAQSSKGPRYLASHYTFADPQAD